MSDATLLVVIAITAGVLTLVTVALVASATVAVWRMTRTHERLEQHVAAIQRQLARRDDESRG